MTRRRRKSTRVFLSHSAKDRSFVVRLAAFLRQHKIPYWYSAHHIAGANQWHDEIGRALRKCDWFLIVLSPDSVKSTWVKRELLYALQNDRYSGRIIPLLFKRCEHAKLSWTLSSFQFVLFDKDFDHICRQVLKALGKHPSRSRR